MKKNESGVLILKFFNIGIGISEYFDLRKTESLGLIIVVGFVEHQLSGEIKFKYNIGVTYKIKFKPKTLKFMPEAN